MGIRKLLKIAFKADQKLLKKHLLHPENDFLYEPRSKAQHIDYINKLSRKGKSNAGQKV